MEHDMTRTPEHDTQVTFITLDGNGKGSIEAKADQFERLEEFTQEVGSGAYHIETDIRIPCGCIDGRCGDKARTNAAGGTETLMVADDLTTKDFAIHGETTTAEQYEKIVRFLVDAGHPVGGHTAEDLHGAPSGCGANDKLPAIYEYMAQEGDVLRGIVESLGIDVSDEDHASIISHAATRSEFSDGAELLESLRKFGGKESVDTLEKDHKEVIAVINTRQGTTLNRAAVQEKYGDNYQAFNVDVWSFDEGARIISRTDDPAVLHRKKIAMLYYNLATAGVLCGPGMRVTVLS
jgi:hypothetical protein